MEKHIYLITFIIYYLIATFLLVNIILNPKIKLTLVNKKTKEEKEPSAKFLFFYCLLWIIFMPLTVFKGEEN